jgi:AraC family transcriptional regulator
VSDYYLERIQRGVDFVEANLDASIALAEVARAGGLSQWHFQRIFKSLTGETLKTYIRSRRMACALDRLLTTDLRILDIALLAGFETQESFTRAFKKAFDMAPSAYRKIGKRNVFLKKLRLDGPMLEHLQHNVSTEPTIVERPAMTLVGLRTTFYGPDSEKNNIGKRLPPLWDDFLARRHEITDGIQAVCYGVVRQERDDDDRLEYFAAVEAPADRPLPAAMEAVEIPAATYATFEHRGPATDIDRTVSYAYSTWLIQSGHRHSGAADLEIYDDRFHATDPSSVYVYALPVEV